MHIGIVIFKVNSNWGGDFTCLYRVSIESVLEAWTDDGRCVCTETLSRPNEGLRDLRHQVLDGDTLLVHSMLSMQPDPTRPLYIPHNVSGLPPASTHVNRAAVFCLRE